jgi:phosphoserine phosphatase
VSRFLVVFDVDSTLIRDEVIELLAEEAGKRNEVALITEAAMRGELDFAASLIARVSVLEGLPQSVITKTFERVTLTPGVQELIDHIHSAGGLVGAVSGGFSQILNLLAPTLKLDFWLANELEITDEKLTGRVSGSVVDKTAKAQALVAWSMQADVELQQTVAVGDGANDLEMMGVAGLGVAFNAKPLVRQRANLVAEKVDLAELKVLFT